MSEESLQGLVEFELHNTYPGAVAAVRNTLSMLPGKPALVERDGRWYVPDGFCAHGIAIKIYDGCDECCAAGKFCTP